MKDMQKECQNRRNEDTEDSQDIRQIMKLVDEAHVRIKQETRAVRAGEAQESQQSLISAETEAEVEQLEGIKIGSMNVRSIRRDQKKTDMMGEFLSSDLDVLCVQETWLDQPLVLSKR